jgi:hypothetical protein
MAFVSKPNQFWNGLDGLSRHPVGAAAELPVEPAYPRKIF